MKLKYILWGVALALCIAPSDPLHGRRVTDATWRTPTPTYSVGGAVWYAPGVMETNCEYRGFGRVPGVALMSPSDIGKTVWLRPPGGEWEGPYKVCDCAMRGDMFSMVMWRHEVVEVDWRTAVRWGLGPHEGGWRLDGVEVLVDPAGPVWWPPVDYEDWFIRIAKFDAPDT